MTTLEQDLLSDLLSNQFGNGQANAGLAMTPEQAAVQVNYSPSPDDAARLFFSDPAWKLRFEARCELELAKQKAEAEEMIREGQEKLAALWPSGKPKIAKAKWRSKAVTKAPKAKKAAKAMPAKSIGDTETTQIALNHIANAGKEGIGTIRLGKLLGTSAGPVVAPLVEAGKVKVKGAKRGTVYFSV